MLVYERHLPGDPREGAPLIVLLHGRGSHERDLLSLRSHLPSDAVVVTPRATHEGGPWGYGPGWAWYRYLERDRMVPDTIEASLSALDGLLEELGDALPVRTGPLVLGGFSQGGTTSLAWALSRPGRVAGVLNFSGFLPADGIVDVSAGEGLKVFWGHGRHDPAIPWALAVEGRRRLSEAGADITAVDLDIGHWIDPTEADAASRWTEGLVADSVRAEG
jgi:phospholipase/carboxylesterase